MVISRVQQGIGRSYSFPWLLIAFCLLGCTRTAEKYSALNGLNPQLSSTDIQAYATQQQAIMLSLVSLAYPGTTTVPAVGSQAWYYVVLAGADYVDQKCDAYINALFWFNRWRNSVKSDVALTGAATAAAMGVLRSSAQAISLTATAFGLATGLIDVDSNVILYSIDPTALRTVLQKAQGAYRDAIASKKADYVDETSAIQAVQGYLGLCLPAGLESLINNSVATASVQANQTAAGNPVPSLTVNPPVATQPALPSAPRRIVSQVFQPLSQPVLDRKNALERYVRTLASKVINNTAPKADLDKFAAAIGAQIFPTPNEERSAIVAFIESNLASPDQSVNEQRLADMIASLNAAGIRPDF